jgi:CRP-like cAMP-binding protein
VESLYLRRVPFLAEISESDIALVAHAMRRRNYRRGEVIFRQDDPGNALYLIESGTVKISRQGEDGREITLTLLHKGEYFGELALLDEEPRSADAIAVEATTVYLLPKAEFKSFLLANPHVPLQMLSAMSRMYVRRLTDAVQDAVFLDVPARLARVIVQMHVSTPRTDAQPLRTTQADLASMIGATRESVNKWLGYFERRGWVKRSRGALSVLDAPALTRASHGEA